MKLMILWASPNIPFAYDQSGHRASLTYPNGVVATYSYDQGDRLTSLVHKKSARQVVAESVYTHDQIGNRLSKTTTDEELRYGYDAIYRLLSVRPDRNGHGNHDGDDHDDQHGDDEEHTNSESYRYDPVGNRLSGPSSQKHQPGYVYDAANRLLEDRHYRYQYDRNGNLITKSGKDGHDDHEESWSYRYDFENRLVEAVKHGDDEAVTVTFAYDPMGRRIEKHVAEREDGKRQTRTTRYLYDNEDILLETDAAGKVINRYLHGPGIDEPLALVQGKATYYYHADGLGSIVALTDTKGKVAQEYQYDSFGNLHDQMNRVKQPYTYTSREWDKETGLYYYRARYYDAEGGRFISKDPIGFGGGVNTFSYVDGNPVNMIDPNGLMSFRHHGYWGGPGWTAGQRKAEKDLTPADFLYQALDARDECYKGHDICIFKCAKKSECPDSESDCIEKCDHQLGNCLFKISPFQSCFWVTSTGVPINAHQEAIQFRTTIPAIVH